MSRRYTLSPASAGPLLSRMVLPSLMETLKPVFDDTDPEAEDRAFATALAIARAFVGVRIARNAAKLRAEAIVLEAIATAGDSRILELPGHALPPADREGGRRLTVVRHQSTRQGLDHRWHPEIRRRFRAPRRPSRILGWSVGKSLEAATGVPGALFCHNGRFIAAAATREAAIAMAENAVREAEQNNDATPDPGVNERLFQDS